MKLGIFCFKKKIKMPFPAGSNHVHANGHSHFRPSEVGNEQLSVGVPSHCGSGSAGSSTTMESPPRSLRVDQIGGPATPCSDPELITSTEVTIRDPTTEEGNSISGVLQYCKHRILYPYLRLLGIMGLKPLGIPDPEQAFTCAILMNKIYFGFVTTLLIIGYVLQFMTCYRRDRGFTVPSEPPHTYRFTDQGNSTTTCSGNPLSAHIVPNLLHFGSFIYMVYLYRFNDDEQLPNLMERVFIQASHAHSSFFSQKKLLRTLQFMVLFSATWVILSIGCQVTQITTHSFNVNPWRDLRSEWKQTLMSLLIFSGIWQDAVQVTVIVSYCIHCRLLSGYFNLIHSRIQQHSITLTECIKEIGELDKLLNYLNNDLAPALGPLMVMDATLAVSSIAFIFDKGAHLQILDLVSLTITAVLWVLIVLLPIFESAKLSTSSKSVSELGHLVRMRPFGYQDIPQTDLDSFLLFVSTLKMEVHVCQIPITTSVISTIFTSALCFLILWGLISV